MFFSAVVARSRDVKLQALSRKHLIETESFVLSVKANLTLIEKRSFVLLFNPIVAFSFISTQIVSVILLYWGVLKQVFSWSF